MYLTKHIVMQTYIWIQKAPCYKKYQKFPKIDFWLVDSTNKNFKFTKTLANKDLMKTNYH